MASGLKHKLDKVLHRREPSDEQQHGNGGDGGAPSPAVLRTEEEKRQARQKSSSLRDLVRSASRSRTRPGSRNGHGAGQGAAHRPGNGHIADTTPPRSSREHTPQSPRMPRGAGSTVRRVDDYRDLSSEFKQLEVNDGTDSSLAGGPIRATYGTGGGGGDAAAGAVHGADHLARRLPSRQLEQDQSARDPYSESVADFNLARDESMLAGGIEDPHAIRQVLQRDHREDAVQPRRSRDVGRDGDHSRRSNDQIRPGSSRASNDLTRGTLATVVIPARDASLDWQRQSGSKTRSRANTGKRLSLDKPLPPPPEGHAVKNFSTPSTQPRSPPDHLVSDSATAIDLAAHGIDLSNTEDTSVHTTHAPAVVHEQVRVDTHEIITERIEREIHTHDVFHRVLPIVDIQVLPPRHFIQTPSGGRYEISPEQAPGGAPQNLNLQRVIQEAVDREVARMYPPHTSPRHFTAIGFDPHGTVGDLRAGVGDDGCQYSEQTWVHHPVLETGGYETGQTVPFHFDHHHPAAGTGDGRGAVGDGELGKDAHEAGRRSGSLEMARRASVTARKPVQM